MKIKNVIFDVGNVLVRWTPLEVIESIFPQFTSSEFYQRMRPIWIDLNLGKISEEAAIENYQSLFNLPKKHFIQLMNQFKIHQNPLPGSIKLLDKLQTLNINLFALTDNTKEIIKYHKIHSAFPKYFKDIIVSADIGILKPNPQIYKHLIDKYSLNPLKSVFIDDSLKNVEGAIKVGIHSFQFIDHISCKQKLMTLLNDDER